MSMHDFKLKLESNDQEFKSFRELTKKPTEETFKAIVSFFWGYYWY